MLDILIAVFLIGLGYGVVVAISDFLFGKDD